MNRFGYLQLQEEVNRLQQRLLTEQWQTASLRSDVARLAEKIRIEKREGKIIQQCYMDASLLYFLQLAGSPISREKMVPEILKRGRWARGVAFMRLAGVSNQDGLIVTNAEEARYAFEAKRSELERKGYTYLYESGYLPPRSAR